MTTIISEDLIYITIITAMAQIGQLNRYWLETDACPHSFLSKLFVSNFSIFMQTSGTSRIAGSRTTSTCVPIAGARDTALVPCRIPLITSQYRYLVFCSKYIWKMRKEDEVKKKSSTISTERRIYRQNALWYISGGMSSSFLYHFPAVSPVVPHYPRSEICIYHL